MKNINFPTMVRFPPKEPLVGLRSGLETTAQEYHVMIFYKQHYNIKILLSQKVTFTIFVLIEFVFRLDSSTPSTLSFSFLKPRIKYPKCDLSLNKV